MNLRSLLSIMVILIVMSATSAVYAEQSQAISVTDLAGRTVDIPANVSHVASLVGPGYEKIFMLGAMDKVAVVASSVKQNPWVQKIIPDVSKIQGIASADNPNVEELVNQKVDLAFFWDYDKPMQKMADAGITQIKEMIEKEIPEDGVFTETNHAVVMWWSPDKRS